MELLWHSYRYYPYEKDLGLREIAALLAPETVHASTAGVRIKCPAHPEAASRLVYFAQSRVGSKDTDTIQARLERDGGNGFKRQSTRYSVHGLHEYKGKFNPQVAKAILNLLGLRAGSRVLDPFCGSGTTLIESAQLGMRATGTDMNPLAVFIANAKLDALNAAPSKLQADLGIVISRYRSTRASTERTARRTYLANWFDPRVLNQIERLKAALSEVGPANGRILGTIASDLLRDYSQQDPKDLRIRRRSTPLPEVSFMQAFQLAAAKVIERIRRVRAAIGGPPGTGSALLFDSRDLASSLPGVGQAKFDCVLTSPPYATALPYIDTQRLSLVWLGLLEPSDLLTLEARLVGSREIRGQRAKALLSALGSNSAGIPSAEAEYCAKLQRALRDTDGFRRRAVPALLYRYFTGMDKAFRAVRSVARDGAPFALVVGTNHTVLGGKKYVIETPSHLVSIAQACGWRSRESIPLQTYHRYGYHMSNAVKAEALIILEAA